MLAGTCESPVYLVSGGTGRTADQVVKAALAQFDKPHVCLIHQTQVRSIQAARNIVRQAAKNRGMIVHTLVEPKVREAVLKEAERRLVPTVDLLGPVLHSLEDHLHIVPRNQPGLSYELFKEQFDRMDAVDFTLAHDDGEMLRTISEADVVLVGVSRVAKSVTCFYLAYRGIRAANVPLIPELQVPSELTALEPTRVIGLTMNVHRLQAIRSARLGKMRYGSVNKYVDVDELQQELRYATELMHRNHWNCIDVSYLAVEEIATRVLETIDASLGNHQRVN